MNMTMGAPWCADWRWSWPHWAGPTGFVLVNELEADASSTNATAFVGAQGGNNAVVEYLVDAGASSPSVEVTILAGGATTDWKDTGIAAGFHVHHIGHLVPGAKITLTVAAAMARVRWCEAVCC